MKVNKMQMYVDLAQWIEVGFGTADLIYDAPFQHPQYAPYVVAELIKKTPVKHIPGAVLEKLKDELIKENEWVEPKKPWWKLW